MSKRKIRELRPWNVKPGMLIMLGVRPASSWEGPASDWHEVIEVEKTRGKVTGARCWRITYKSHAYNPPFTGKPESVLRFRDQRVTVEGCNLFRCCRCGEHFDGRGDWSVYCQPKDTK